MSEPRDPADPVPGTGAEPGSEAEPGTKVEPEASPSAAVPPATPQTELRTFLIADIRGYTTYTREHGDEAGAALASRFAELVSEVVTARDGYLLELRGDEALVVFVSARKALRAAVDLQARFAEDQLPRGVGIGLDAGEAIPVGNGFRGTALNLAARLCAKAGPGETLASSAVIHLAAKIEGIAYVDAQELKLKGYADAVRAVVVLPSDRARGHRPASADGSRPRDRGRYAIAGVALVAVAVAVGAVGGGLLRGGAPGVPGPTQDPFADVELPVLAFYDAETGNLKATTSFKYPTNLAFYAADSFWMVERFPTRFERLDPVTHTVEQTINVPVVEPSGFSIDDRYIWVTDLGGPQIVRVDQRTGIPSIFHFGRDESDTEPASDISVGDGSVWLARAGIDEIVRLNAETGKVQKRIPTPAWGLTFGGGSLWFWYEGSMGRIDPVTNEAVFEEAIELTTDSAVGNIHIGGGDAWTSAGSLGYVWRVDGSGHKSTYPLQPGVGDMAATESTMWVTNANTGLLTGIDLTTGLQNRHIDTGHATLAVAAGGGQIMIAVGPTVDEVIAGLDGNVLRMSTIGIPWSDQTPDPPTNGYWEVHHALHMTCVGLLSYPDKPAPEGWTLEPEVAAELPTVSPDKRTYTFTIVPGYAFSPPANEPVTAETFKATIERTLSPVFDDDAPGPLLYSDIVGAKAFRAGKSDHVAGLVASGDELSITLEEPAPDFLYRLASPFACPVPIGTPALRSGLDSSPPVAGAGPYYLEQHLRRRLVVFKKNPNYQGPRAQPFDAIAIEMNTTSAIAIGQVQSGQRDAAILDCCNPITGPGSTIATEWGPGSANAAAGDQRWFGGPRLGVEYIALNPQRGPFSDPDVRRAVSLALNRSELNRIFVQAPTRHLLVPAVPGSRDAEVSIPADLETANALMNGRKLSVTMMGFPEEWGCRECRAFELAVKGQLKMIGIAVTLRHPPTDEYPGDALDPGSEIDLLALGSGSEIPDPVAFMGGLYEDPWLGESNLRELDRLHGLGGQARVDGAAALAERVVDEQFLLVPTGYTVYPLFISERIGCTPFVQPAIGALDLLSLCIEDAAPTPTASP